MNMAPKYRIIPIGGGGLDSSTKYGASIAMSMDQDYMLSVQLLDQDGNALGAEQTVDLPLESVVVGGSYDSTTKSIILTLDNGNTITIPVGDLVAGLPTVNDATITVKQQGQADQTFNLNQASNQDIIIAAGGGNAWYGTQAQFDALDTYDVNTDYFITDKLDYNTDLKNTPDLSKYATKTEVNTKNTEQDTAIAGKMAAQFMTQEEFDNLQNKKEGDSYFIEGNTIEMVVTFTDQTTATYNVVVD